MKTLTVTLPDGTRATRTTKHLYTHAVAVLCITSPNMAAGKTEPAWSAMMWTTKPDQALASVKRTLAKWPAHYKVSDVCLIEVAK